MRVSFKTSYNHDIRLFADGYQASRYAALVVLAVGLPFVLDDFLIGEVTGVLIWAIAGMGLMLLTGHAGQVSLGHAAFLAVGCYAHAILMDRFGLPFLASFALAGVLTGIVGV
ncbi:MAG: branched-chain amino acid ABC transporter permease, partial [Rhodospirillales bacterium]|nr:branched-chain amino acid ABC transporter permease [Rhodospirillales bacterium]